MKRDHVACDRCGKPFRAGTYASHVRRSPSEAHDKDRKFMVDLAGVKHVSPRPSSSTGSHDSEDEEPSYAGTVTMRAATRRWRSLSSRG